MTPYRFALLRIIFGFYLIFDFAQKYTTSDLNAAPFVFGGVIAIAILFLLGYQRQFVSRSLFFFGYLLFVFEGSILQLNHILTLSVLAIFALADGHEPWRILVENEERKPLDLKKLKLFTIAEFILVIGSLISTYVFSIFSKLNFDTSLTVMLIIYFVLFFIPSFLFKAKPTSPNSILFFDGVCGLCSHIVDFVLVEDSKSVFKVAALQSETAKEKLPAELRENLNTVVLLNSDGTIYQKSEAILNVLYEIGGFWRLFFVFRILPRPLTDLVYSLVAKFRYEIFGKKETCRLPTPSERAQFLN